MQKLHSLRTALTAACPDLARDPDRLVIFAEQGKVEKRLRVAGLSCRYTYTATLLVTDWAQDADAVILPLVQWCQQNQPDMTEQITFEADLLNHDTVDLVVHVPLTEFVAVTDNGNGTVSTAHLPEPVYVGDNRTDALPADPEWATHPGNTPIT